MVDFTDNPYATAEIVSEKPTRPTKITVIGVFGIILGVMYLLGFCASVPAIVMHVVMPDAFISETSDDRPEMKMQVEIQREMNAVTRAYLIPSAIISLINLAAGSCLVYGGIKVTYSDKRAHLQFFRNICLACVFLVLVSAAFGFAVQYANWGAVQRSLTNIPAGPQRQMFISIMNISLVFSIGFVVIYQVLQLVYFFVSRRMLKSYVDTLSDNQD